ncbi:MAG TPA: tetratricopeptide repeat protein [Acidobacteriaceae bacterium]|nr:tetratricopeptide repeat protein [Acidobacteriaceae bacterium]
MLRSRRFLSLALILVAVFCAYANHFHNGFHFDDSHTVVDNPYIRSLRNLPRFFTDTTTFSVLPANRTYRPMVSASLAVDYALGQGYNPFWFQLSTFVVFLVQLVAMYVLFGAILAAVRPDAACAASNRVVSLLAVAWYGLHPAMAETVNYVIQRGDVYCAFGVVAALAVYARWPGLRRTGLYLVPLAFALLSKPPAVVFPVLLVLYLVLFEEQGSGKWKRGLRASIPSFVVCAALMGLQAAMTPKSFAPSMLSPTAYRITQPYVLLRYFGSFFLPIHLNVDTDLRAFSTFNLAVLTGFVFLGLLLFAAWVSVRHRQTRPIAFGLLWFVIASLPTSLFVLSEVENDHRMFLPFVGLVLSVCWAAALGIEGLIARMPSGSHWKAAAVVCAVLLLVPYAWGTHVRNAVWRSDESLWRDDVLKCPQNGRGLMNYGLTQMAKGNYPVALDYFERALAYTPNYPTLEINLGVVNGALRRGSEAGSHFLRALQLDPASDAAHFFYGRWLYENGDLAGATAQLKTAVALNPSRLDARDLLAMAYRIQGSLVEAKSVAQGTLRLAPSDGGALTVLSMSSTSAASYWIDASLAQYRSGQYSACIADAQRALLADPSSALAYNNIGAAYAASGQWDLAIRNEREALHFDPKLVVAQNNLRTYTVESLKKPDVQTPEDLLNASLRAFQAGQFQRSIDQAERALKLRPSYAEAYNNIAASYSAMHQWNPAIAAAQKAVSLKPDFQLAKNNLAWAESQLHAAH